MKHEDYIYKHDRRWYRYSCDRCKCDMGNMRPYNAKATQHFCRSCQSLPDEIPTNVHVHDFRDKHGARYYRTDCISCGEHRGYLAIANSQKKCRRCSKNTYQHIRELPGIDKNDWKEAKDHRREYRMTCVECQADRGYQRESRYHQGLCKSCSSKKTHTGREVSEETRAKMSENSWIRNISKEDHPFYGRSHSEETKHAMSQKQKEHCEKHGNQFVTGKSKGKHTQDTIARISEGNIGKEPRWKGRVFQYDGPKGKFKLRSSYELAYANWMDSNNVEWEYEPHYRLSDGRLFSPDFQLATGEIIEIKGFWSEKGKAKWELFCLDYPELKKSVLFKEDLLKIGIEV